MHLVARGAPALALLLAGLAGCGAAAEGEAVGPTTTVTVTKEPKPGPTKTVVKTKPAVTVTVTWTATSPPFAVPPGDSGEGYRGDCDANYSGYCVPIVMNDLDCKDIGYHTVYVVGRDVHGFDRDGDGKGCE